ncbi:MFS transporter [Paenibacillus chungangensis]|uniref:MFS transporter n=1 Tax=Paenibacillus chungangensis TaxID=696535 RepID=A0ABW3HM25_9BACL
MKGINAVAAQERTGDLSATAKRETAALRSFSFLTFATQALVVSFIPLYFLDMGFTEGQIGIIYSTGPFISIFANILMGFASDKYRTIRKLLLLLLLGQLVMIGLLLPVSQFAIVCVMMTAFYFFQTPILPLSDSMILLSSKHTGTPYALVRIFGSLGFACCAYTFGLLLKQIGTEWTLALTAGTISLSFIATLLLKDYQESAVRFQFSGFFKLLRERRVLFFFLLILLVSVSHRMYESFLAVTMRQLGASDSLVGLAWLVSAVSEIPILFLLGKYGHKLRELPLLVFASLMYALRLWLIGRIEEPAWIIAVQTMHSITFGVYFSSALRYISHLIPDEYRSSGQAVYAVVWIGLAGLASGVLGGFLYEQFGRAVFYQTGTAIGLAAAAGFLVYHFRSRGV